MLIKRSTNSLRESLRPGKISIVARSLGYWVLFLVLIMPALQRQLPFGSANAGVVGCIATGVMLLLTAWLLRMDGDTFREIGIHFDLSVPKQFFVGTGLGLAVIGIMIAIILALTPVTVQTNPDSNVLAILVASFLILFILALMEEVVFRSYPLFRLKQAWGIRPAVYISSVIFAFYHGLAFENLLGPGVWGLFFAWMAFSTNSIALPTGFHLGLNWMQALLGMKPQYGESIWQLSAGTDSGVIAVETVGLIMQLVLLVVGVFMVEKLVAKQRRNSST